MKIVKQIDENTFIISLKDYKKESGIILNIAHDYVEFSGTTALQTDFTIMKDSLEGRHAFCSNNISIPVDVQIPIKAFKDICLPKLLENKYLQEKHFEDREYAEDDIYWDKSFNIGKFTGPRYKKGDKYPAYSHYDQTIFYYENKEKMVAFLKAGDKNWNIFTYKFYKKHINKD
jgi:hypothetical protein